MRMASFAGKGREDFSLTGPIRSTEPAGPYCTAACRQQACLCHFHSCPCTGQNTAETYDCNSRQNKPLTARPNLVLGTKRTENQAYTCKPNFLCYSPDCLPWQFQQHILSNHPNALVAGVRVSYAVSGHSERGSPTVGRPSWRAGWRSSRKGTPGSRTCSAAWAC